MLRLMLQRMKEILAIQMVKRGKKRYFSMEEMEVKHVDPSRKGFNDSSYFAGISRSGFSFVTRLAFRVDKPNENWLMLSTPDDGIWGFENMNFNEGEGFRQGELKYICTNPGKRWRITYQGFLPKGNKKENVEIDIHWEGSSPVVNFDKTGTTPEQVGMQIAKEKWNKKFFSRLRELDQVHYEQAGQMKGTIKWKGITHELEFKGVRDHSWGVRNWDDWDRHFWLLGLMDDDRFFNFSLISYRFVKNLQAAFIWEDGKFSTIYNIPDFEELDLGPDLPEKLNFEVMETKNGSKYPLFVDMKTFFPFRMDKSYSLRQAVADFRYKGMKGVGIAEMGINLNLRQVGGESTITGS